MSAEGEALAGQSVRFKTLVSFVRWTVRGACIVAFLLLGGLIVFAGAVKPRDNGKSPRADGIVVLTGGEQRVTEALRLLAAGNGKRLLISGVHPKTTRKALVQLNPESARLFNCCIDLDWNARDTVGNADETKAWFEQQGFRSLIVVTSSYHMPRSMVELRRALGDAVLISHPVASDNFHADEWWAYPGTLRLIVSEYLKFLPAVARCVSSSFFGGPGLQRQIELCLRPADK